MMNIKFFDLFCGIGGFRLGMEKAGHECIGSCEWDKYARETYNKNFGSYPEYNDVKDLSPQSLPQFDVLCAGFPCQSFSVAGKRMGFEDERGVMFFEIARIVKERKPRYLFLENVKGLLSHEKGRTFRTIISILDELGYDVEWQVINSKYFVPQNRERVFIIGHLRGSSTKQVFPLGDFDTETKNTELKQVGNIDTKGHNSIWGRVYDPNGISSTLNAMGGGLGVKTGLYAVVNNKGDFREVKKSTALDSNYWKGCDNHAQRTMVYMANTNSNMVNRIQERDETWTLTNKSNDFDIFSNGKVRRLTPIECERLQGFPDNWTIGSDTQRYKQIGNAVTVPVIEYIARNII